MCDSLYCNICFIAVVWNWSAISLRDVCRASSSTPNQHVTMDHRQDNSCWEKRRRMWSTGWWPVEILYYSCVHIIRSFCTDIGWNSLIKLEFSSQLLQAISCPLLFCGSFLHFPECLSLSIFIPVHIWRLLETMHPWKLYVFLQSASYSCKLEGNFEDWKHCFFFKTETLSTVISKKNWSK